MRLLKLGVENFKGIKSQTFNFGGSNATIMAQNYSGKTSIYDAFLWLLFGKDSQGRADFDIHPLDENNQVISGLITSVEATLLINDSGRPKRTVIVQRQLHEKIVKGQLRGYETLCEIDGVPRKVNEYNTCIYQELIPESRFKLLTDVQAFNRLPWTERRKMLMELAGISSGYVLDGFMDVTQDMGNRTPDEYRTMLNAQKKRYKDEREGNTHRIDEIHKGLPTEEKDTSKLEERRNELRADVDKLNVRMEQVLSQEAERQNKLDDIAELKGQMKQREIELANDTSGQKSLLDERKDLEKKLYDAQADVERRRQQALAIATTLQSAKREYHEAANRLAETRDSYTIMKAAKLVSICELCGQTLPAEKVPEVTERRQNSLQHLKTEGNNQKKEVQKLCDELERITQQANEMDATYREAQSSFESVRTDIEARTSEIERLLKERPKVVPEADGKWCDLRDELVRAEKEVGPPVAEQLEKLSTEKRTLLDEMGILLEILAQRDRTIKDRQRITDLEARETELTQLMADSDAKLERLGEYVAAQCRAVEVAVNDRFEYAKFRMFKQRLNENIEECCDTLFHGVPWNGLSYGESVKIGLDIINTLSEHYKESAPIFIDGAEGVTFDVETDAQVIKLIAKKGVKTLTMKRE